MGFAYPQTSSANVADLRKYDWCAGTVDGVFAEQVLEYVERFSRPPIRERLR
jgi:hypothetical protein